MKIALYRAVTGNYEHVNEEPAPQGADCFLFTDSAHTPPRGWECIQVKPRCIDDPIRSARALKILGHDVLNEYDTTIWVDNRVQLKKSAPEIVNEYLDESDDLAVPMHSFHSTLREEFNQVIRGTFDDPRRIREQRAVYERNAHGLLDGPVYWTAILIRRNTVANTELSGLWWEFVLRHSRRDQLSFPLALHLSRLTYNAFPVDNHQSEMHDWRTESAMRRNIASAHWSPSHYTDEVADLLRSARSDLRARRENR